MNLLHVTLWRAKLTEGHLLVSFTYNLDKRSDVVTAKVRHWYKIF